MHVGQPKTARTGQGQDRRDRREDGQNMTARTGQGGRRAWIGQPEQDIPDNTAGQDGRDKTARPQKRQLDDQNMASWTGKLGQDSNVGQPKQES